MANLNKVMLIGRLTRDPELKTFSTGGKVAKVGFAVNNRRKNRDTGQWEDEPVFIDVEVFNRGENSLADRIAETVRKGQQIFIEGRLRMDSWTTQDGQKRNKLVVVADNFQYLEPRDFGGGEGGNAGNSGSYARRTSSPHSEPVYVNSDNGGGGDDYSPDAGGANGNDDDIPF